MVSQNGLERGSFSRPLPPNRDDTARKSAEDCRDFPGGNDGMDDPWEVM